MIVRGINETMTVSVRPAPKGGCGEAAAREFRDLRGLSEARPEGRVRLCGC